MASNFSLYKFIENTDKKLLQKYLKRKGISIILKNHPKTSQLVEYFKKLPIEILQVLEADFIHINAMADEIGILHLKNEARQKNIKMPELTSGEAGAFWFFLEHPQDFEEAFIRERINDRNYWHDEETENINAEIDWDKKATLLNQEFKNHFWEEEKRKIESYTEVLKYQDRILFVVYCQGYPQAKLHFQDQKLTHVSTRPVHEIHYIIHLQEQRLSIKTNIRYSTKKINKMKELFFRAVLQQPFINISSRIFHLNKFFDERFGTTLQEKIPPGDKVAYIKVTELELKDKDKKGQKIILQAQNNHDSAEIYAILQERRINTSYFDICAVKIRVKFLEKENGGVTFKLKEKNMHNLGQDVWSLKCRKYIQMWNL